MQGSGSFYEQYVLNIKQIICQTSVGVKYIELYSYRDTPFAKISGKVFYIQYDINMDLICLIRHSRPDSGGGITIKSDDWLHAMRDMPNFMVGIKDD